MALIILAHPNYAQSVANRAVINGLQGSGLDLEIRPIAELYPDFQIDAAAEQQALLRHQTIVFQYPFYWYNMPAILKQWFDCVFTYGFAYGSGAASSKAKILSPALPWARLSANTTRWASIIFPWRNFAKTLPKPRITRR